MFGIGFLELFVILVVALVVIGPQDMPKVARQIGRYVAKGRKLVAELRTMVLEDENSPHDKR